MSYLNNLDHLLMALFVGLAFGMSSVMIFWLFAQREPKKSLVSRDYSIESVRAKQAATEAVKECEGVISDEKKDRIISDISSSYMVSSADARQMIDDSLIDWFGEGCES